MRIGIIGFGALGGLYAHYFSRAEGAETFFIASGERYERLKARPLVVNGKELDIGIEKSVEKKPAENSSGNSIEEVSPADMLIFAVKHHHLAEAIEEARGHVGDSTIIFSVMNGIDSEERITGAFGGEHVLYAVALGMDAVREKNRVLFSTPGKLLVGRAHNEGEADKDLATVQNLCDETGLPWETPQDMIRNLWWKFMINIGINQSSAILRADYGAFLDSEHARSVMIRAMEEVIEVASLRGVQLGEEEINTFVGTILPSMSREGKTSMCQDVEAGRKTEVEMFSGTLIRIGEELGVPTPVNRSMFLLIKAIEEMEDH